MAEKPDDKKTPEERIAEDAARQHLRRVQSRSVVALLGGFIAEVLAVFLSTIARFLGITVTHPPGAKSISKASTWFKEQELQARLTMIAIGLTAVGIIVAIVFGVLTLNNADSESVPDRTTPRTDVKPKPKTIVEQIGQRSNFWIEDPALDPAAPERATQATQPTLSLATGDVEALSVSEVTENADRYTGPPAGDEPLVIVGRVVSDAPYPYGFGRYSREVRIKGNRSNLDVYAAVVPGPEDVKVGDIIVLKAFMAAYGPSRAPSGATAQTAYVVMQQYSDTDVAYQVFNPNRLNRIGSASIRRAATDALPPQRAD